MKHMPVVSLVLLFGSMTAAAQSFGPGSIQTTVLNAVPPSSDCPIGMRVQHGNGDQLLWAKDRPVGIAQYLQVIMSNSKSVDIVGAKITVYGFAAKTRYIPAQSPRTSSPDLTKTVGLDLMVKSKGDQSTDLRLPHFTAVSWVDLDSVTYADGTTWHSSVGKTCHVVPELMRLVSSR